MGAESEIRGVHTVNGLKIEFKPRPIWEPYVEAVPARQRQEQSPSPTYHFGAEDGTQTRDHHLGPRWPQRELRTHRENTRPARRTPSRLLSA